MCDPANFLILAQEYWFQTSGLRNYERVNFCFLDHNICGDFLQSNTTWFLVQHRIYPTCFM